MSAAAPAQQLLAEDERARRQALDPNGSFLVEAPAGAGKTELLVQRFLALLAVVEEPEQIVALTFTNKAAAEMRQRLAAALATARLPPPSQEPDRGRWQLAAAALERDAARGWNLGANPSRLRAYTFDAFCRALVERTPWLSRLGSLPAAVAEGDEILRRAAADLLRSYLEGETGDDAEAFRILLDHLDNDYPRLEGLLAALLGKRDQWMRHIFSAAATSADWRATLEAALAAAVHAGLERALAAAPTYRVASLPGAEPDELPDWQALAQSLLRKDGDWRQRLPAGWTHPLPEVFRAALAAVRSLPPARYEEAQWQVLAALIAVLRRAAAQLKLTFARENAVDYIEIAQAARAALGEDDQPTDLAYALDARLAHLLVDEFQDTSVLQYDLLVRLTREWTPGDGRSIFLVGDPKQSIYRFREAEVALFLRAQRDGLGRLPLTPLRLRRNFRSRHELVAWVNDAGAAIFPAVADDATRAVPFAASVAAPGGAGGNGIVAVRLTAARDDREEAERVLARVRDVRDRDPLAGIAILVRVKSHAAAIVAALRAAGIAHQTVETERLVSRPVVADLWALTRALAHPADRLAWLAILRAPWCGLALADLAALIEDAEADAPVWRLLDDPARLVRLSLAGRAALLRLIPIVRASLAERERRPWRRAIEGLWTALGGPACLASLAEFTDAQAYLALLDEAEAAGDAGDLDSLAGRLGSLSAAATAGDENPVEIMTIHKAKGLEFDCVIVPGLGRNPRRNGGALLHWDEALEAGAPRLLLAPIASAGQDDAIADFLKHLEGERQQQEMRRLLYVAMTRAKRELYLFGSIAHANKNSLLKVLEPALAQEWAAAEAAAPAPAAAPDAPADQPPQPRLFQRLPAGWQAPAPPPALIRSAAPPPAAIPPVAFEWAAGPRRQIGTVVHAFLCRMANRGAAALPTAATIRAALRQEGVAAADLDEAAAQVARALAAVMDDERGRWLLAPHPEAASESEISGWLDGGFVQGRVDRTFVAEGTRWIVDYKTGVHAGGNIAAFLASERARYRPQLDRYARLFAAVADHPIRLALFFPLVPLADGRLALDDWSASPAAAR